MDRLTGSSKAGLADAILAQKDAERKAGEWVKDEDRKPRTMEVMQKEAQWLRDEIEKDEKAEGGKL